MATKLTGDSCQALFMTFAEELMSEAREVIRQGDDQPYVHFLLDFAEEILEYRSMSLLFERAQFALEFQKLNSL